MKGLAWAAAWAAIVGAFGSELVVAQRAIALADLAPPADRLPPRCVIAPTGYAIGLRVSSNPWRGADRVITGAIRERVARSARVPDAPTFTADEAARFRLRLADGIDESFVAVYRNGGPELVVLYGLRFSAPHGPEQQALEATCSGAASMDLVTIGNIVAAVHGAPSPCALSLYAYLQTLSQ